MQNKDKEFLQYFEQHKDLIKNKTKLTKNQLFILNNFKNSVIELYNKNYTPKEILKALNRFLRSEQNDKKRIGLSLKDMIKVINLLKKQGLLQNIKQRKTVTRHEPKQPRTQTQTHTTRTKTTADDIDKELSQF